MADYNANRIHVRIETVALDLCNLYNYY